MERDFKGVFIPKEIYLDSRLNALDKIIFAEIDSLDFEDGCYASNKYLAEFCQCSETKVSLAISKLTDLGYIKLISFNGRKRILKSCLSKNERHTFKKCKADSQNVKPDNISDNTNLEKLGDNKDSERKNVKKESSKTFTVPTVEEVAEYCNERNNNIDAEAFIDYYTARNWMIGKTKMHDWKAAIRTWERRKKDSSSNQTNGQDSVIERLNSLSYKDIETYCKAQNYTHVNAMEFLSNYRKRNWKVGNTVITDWHSAVDEWEARELRKIKEKQDEEYKIYHRSYMDRCLNRQ